MVILFCLMYFFCLFLVSSPNLDQINKRKLKGYIDLMFKHDLKMIGFLAMERESNSTVVRTKTAN